MQESLATEHGSELVADTLEELLDGGGVTDEGGRHLEATGGNGAQSGLDVVGDPLNEVALVLVLDVAHLVLNLLHGDLTAEQSGASEVAAVTEVGGSHHVLGVEHLLGQLGDVDLAVRVATTAGQGSEADHEEVQTREGNHVDGELAKIGVELTGETKGGGHTGHDGGDEVVQVTVGRLGELEGTHANVVESLILSVFFMSVFPRVSYLVIDTESLVRVLNKLVNGEGSVVRLNNGVGDLGGGDDGESGHHTVGELLTDLRDQECTHTGTGTTTQGVGDLETLEAVTALGLTADDIEDLVNKLGTLSVVTLSPVVTSTGLTEDEVVGAEKLAEGTGADSIHGTGLQIDQNGTGNVLVTAGLDCQRKTSDQMMHNQSIPSHCTHMVEVDVHTLELEVGGTIVPSKISDV